MTSDQQPKKEPDSRTPVVIINGFLGSGKTTMLTNLVTQARREEQYVAVIVNDMSELDVDGLIVSQAELFDTDDRNFQSIYSCVLSSKRGIEQLKASLSRIGTDNPLDLVIIETSGSCHPMPLVEYFQSEARFRLTGVLVLVDGAMVAEDYQCGEKIFPLMQHNVQNEIRDTTNLLVEQIMFCSHLILTKVDRIHEVQLQRIVASVHELNPYVGLMSVPYGNLPIGDVLQFEDYDFHRVATLMQELKPVFAAEESADKPYDMATRVIRDDRPFHPQRLWDTCQHHLGQRIYRSKGFFYLCTRDHLSLLWNQAAGGISLELIGYWRAAILENEDNGLDQEEIEGLRKRLENETGRFGDRR
ncbi:MAG: GTP-binding protein, partial [Planctomycetota bacterium]